MATRTIVTSQPDVACDVCERRLLRGEQPDVFLAAGRRRIVCELCAPRAAHEGWMRESDSQSLTLPPMRARRGRSFFDRLRQVGKPAGETAVGPSGADAQEHPAPASYDLFDGHGEDPGEPIPATGAVPEELTHPEDAQAPDPAEVAHWQQVETLPPVGSETIAAQGSPSAYVEDAIAIFNASEFPRRVAGVARSLGAPVVNIRPAEHLSSVISIVVAWELCWYRYEVDLSEPVVEAQVIAQGTELGELPREDRRPNAAAAESGTLALSAV